MFGLDQFMIWGEGRCWSCFYEHSYKFFCCFGGARLEQLIHYYNVMPDSALLSQVTWYSFVNPLNAELNFICHLLTLLGAHHILYVSRIRFKTAFCQATKRYSKHLRNSIFPLSFIWWIGSAGVWNFMACSVFRDISNDSSVFVLKNWALEPFNTLRMGSFNP